MENQLNHILDNPIWNGLNAGNQHLGSGTESVKYFNPEVAPFAGMKSVDSETLEMLYNFLPTETTIASITAQALNVVAPWQLLNHERIFQMVYEGGLFLNPTDIDIVPLNTSHVPRMLELTALTKPGPFLVRTIEFGNYHGVFDGDLLVAMAGFRMQPKGYIEISAVCTDPDYVGKGYGSALLKYVANHIIARGETPFLHVRPDNSALPLYKKLGFTIRQNMHLNVIKK